MLKNLRVKNYILIKELEINPDSELVVITGETGAGKSILLGAIGLLMGQRADTKSLFDEKEKCIIEGVFNVKDYKLKSLFDEYAWDYFDECIIRREINPAGRSRAFVNDSPANLNDLKILGEKLLDIHSQHESILVNTTAYQLTIIDAFAGNESLLEEYKTSYQSFREIKKQRDELVFRKEKENKDNDFKAFLLKELEEANLSDGEKERIEEELKISENAELILQYLNSFHHIMEMAEPSAMLMLKEAQTSLSKIVSYSEAYEKLFSRFESTQIELNDIVAECERLTQDVDLDPERLSELRERINLIQRLETKHHVTNFSQLIKIREELNSELGSTLDLDSEIRKLNASILAGENDLKAKAGELSERRKKVAPIISQELKTLLVNLGIDEAQIIVEINEKEFGETGADNVAILFSANKGQKAVPLKEAASGGEISRLMLAIKYLIADKTDLPTIIFDEIDTGISGKIANQMGQMFRTIARGHQVIAITHLPQIAAKGLKHFVVYKTSDQYKTSTQMQELSGEERIIEIAQMISGKKDSSSAIASAKELLEHN